MEVSFQGFKNAGVQKHIICINGTKKANFTIFNTELTNDFVNKDLTDFEQIFKKSANKYNRNFLNFQVLQNLNQTNTNYPDFRFYVNNDEYEANENNLELFGKIARLLKRITDTKEKDFKVNKDYLESDDMKKNFSMRYIEDNRDLIESMHEPKTVKKVAGDLLEIITNEIDEALS